MLSRTHMHTSLLGCEQMLSHVHKHDLTQTHTLLVHAGAYIHIHMHQTNQAYKNIFFMHFFVQSQLIQIYSVDWTDVYDTHNIEHRTEPVSH